MDFNAIYTISWTIICGEIKATAITTYHIVVSKSVNCYLSQTRRPFMGLHASCYHPAFCHYFF